MSSSHDEIPVSDDVELCDEGTEESLTPVDPDPSAVAPHSAPTVILIPPPFRG